MEDNQSGMTFMYPLMFMGIFAIFGISISGRKANMQVDEKIKAHLREAGQGSGASFELCTAWTGPCKPKGARTYRALWIYPAGQVVAGQPAVTGVPMVAPAAPSVMLVTVPVGSKAGDTLNIQSPSGMQMQVQVPPGVQEGGSFQVAMPAAPPVVVAASAVVVPTTTA